MNKKQYLTTLIVFGVFSAALIASNAFLEYLQWVWIVLIISVGYFFIRYRISQPLQLFSNKFNMLVDYDLDVEGALKLVQEYYDNAPNLQVKSLFMIYLGMANYYNGNYREAINTFNQINLKKVNQIYHILIFAFTAYSAYEENDTEAFDIAMDRLEQAKLKVNRKYFSFVSSYIEILTAMKTLESDPENYKEVIERNFSREDGYVSTRLVYNYRMGLYYKTIGDEKEMDICFATVIANGKNHHTALQSKKYFKGTCNVSDYVFPDPADEPLDVDVVEEPKQIEQLEEVEVVQEEVVQEEVVQAEEDNQPKEVKSTEDLASKSVPDLRDLCRERSIPGYYKMKKAELIEALEKELNK